MSPGSTLVRALRGAECGNKQGRDGALHGLEPWQSVHLLRLDQPIELLPKLVRKVSVPQEYAGLHISLVGPFVKFADVTKASSSWTSTHFACQVALSALS